MDIQEILTQHFTRKNGKIKSISTGRDASEKYYSDIYLEITDDLAETGKPVKKKDFKKFVADNLPEPQSYTGTFLIPTSSTPEEWVLDFLQRHEINVGFEVKNPGRKMYVNPDIGNDVKDWEKFAMGDLHAYNAESNYFDVASGKNITVRQSYTKESIKDTLAVVLPKLERARRPAMREVLTFKSSKEKSLNHLLGMFLKSMGATRPKFDQKIFKHWMWQVKRYIYGYTVDDPTMLNFFSKQGTGKTSFIRGLTSALEAYTFEPKIDTVKSEGHAKLWSTKYIIFFDEIRVDLADKKDMYSLVSNLKYLLTMDVNMYRTYHTQDMTENPRIFSAISTSNQPLVESLYDKTGMRRFYEIECHAIAEDKTYLALPYIKDLNPNESSKALRIFKNAWRGIDETLKTGYLDNEDRKTLKKIQDEYKKLDCIELYDLHSSDTFDPYIKLTDKKSTKELVALFEENIALSRDKMIEATSEKGYTLETVIKYIKRLEDWTKDDGVEIGIYGGPRMPRELKDHGYFVYKHRDIHYLASKEDKGSSQF